jgi:hypothetical protein
MQTKNYVDGRIMPPYDANNMIMPENLFIIYIYLQLI